MSKIKKKIEDIQIDDSVAYRMPKEHMITMLEIAKVKNPKLYEALIKSIEEQYENREDDE